MSEERPPPGPGIGRRVGGVVLALIGVGFVVYAVLVMAGDILIVNGAGEPVQDALSSHLVIAGLSLLFALGAVGGGVELFTGRAEPIGGGGGTSPQTESGGEIDFDDVD